MSHESLVLVAGPDIIQLIINYLDYSQIPPFFLTNNISLNTKFTITIQNQVIQHTLHNIFPNIIFLTLTIRGYTYKIPSTIKHLSILTHTVQPKSILNLPLQSLTIWENHQLTQSIIDIIPLIPTLTRFDIGNTKLLRFFSSDDTPLNLNPLSFSSITHLIIQNPFYINSPIETLKILHLHTTIHNNNHSIFNINLRTLFLGCATPTFPLPPIICPKLHSLTLTSAHNITKILPLFSQTLKFLQIEPCTHITDIPFTQPSSIQHLKLHKCTHLTNLSFLTYHPNLRTLILSDCLSLTNINGISTCPQLRTLIFSKCPILTAIDSISNCTKLTTLTIHHSPIPSISPLRSCTAIKFLEFDSCKNISDISTLQFLPALQSLNINQCHKIMDLSVLQHCAHLWSLNIANCNKFLLWDSLTQCTSLKVIIASRSNKNKHKHKYKNTNNIRIVEI